MSGAGVAEDVDRGAAGRGLRVVAAGAWPEAGDGAPPPVAGFIVSSFSPLVVAVAERCLRRAHGAPEEADPDRVARTGVLLASRFGDVATARALDEAVRAGRRVPPLLFYQSNPNAVAGHVAARWGLRGPVVATGDGGLDGALDEAELLLLDGDAAELLVIHAEVEPEHAIAVLVGRRSAQREEDSQL